jgi:hypothetical protein
MVNASSDSKRSNQQDRMFSLQDLISEIRNSHMAGSTSQGAQHNTGGGGYRSSVHSATLQGMLRLAPGVNV